MGKNVLLTGATGFLGKARIKQMLDMDFEQFYFLIRRDSAIRELEEEFKRASKDRLHFVNGDITLPYAGINRVDLIHLSKIITDVRHMAASTSFDDSRAVEIERENVTGTGNMIQVASLLDKLEVFEYTSTAYVCGAEQGVIPEARLKNVAGFKNTYERTKLIAENLVRDSNLPFVIIRPSIIMGDSRTKEAKGESRMIYGYLLALYHSALHQTLSNGEAKLRGEARFRHYWNSMDGNIALFEDVNARLYGLPDIPKNLVTLDDVVNVCSAIDRSPIGERIGKTYNLVNPKQLTSGFIIDSMQKALKIRGFRYDPNFNPLTDRPQTEIEKAAVRYTKPFFPYTRIPEPNWQHDNVDALGVDRVVMTPELFGDMMSSYVRKELMGVN